MTPFPTQTEGKRPDPEVQEKANRRRFTAKYKASILRAADACTEPGQIGALLRREGLYSSHLANWRRHRDEAGLAALEPCKHGHKQTHDPIMEKLSRLERENAQQAVRLRQAEAIIAAQKKISEILGVHLISDAGQEAN